MSAQPVLEPVAQSSTSDTVTTVAVASGGVSRLAGTVSTDTLSSTPTLSAATSVSSNSSVAEVNNPTGPIADLEDKARRLFAEGKNAELKVVLDDLARVSPDSNVVSLYRSMLARSQAAEAKAASAANVGKGRKQAGYSWMVSDALTSPTATSNKTAPVEKPVAESFDTSTSTPQVIPPASDPASSSGASAAPAAPVETPTEAPTVAPSESSTAPIAAPPAPAVPQATPPPSNSMMSPILIACVAGIVLILVLAVIVAMVRRRSAQEAVETAEDETPSGLPTVELVSASPVVPPMPSMHLKDILVGGVEESAPEELSDDDDDFFPEEQTMQAPSARYMGVDDFDNEETRSIGALPVANDDLSPEEGTISGSVHRLDMPVMDVFGEETQHLATPDAIARMGLEVEFDPNESQDSQFAVAYEKGCEAFRRQEYSEAVRFLEHALSLQPESAEVRQRLTVARTMVKRV
jgi:hypothetical protein